MKLPNTLLIWILDANDQLSQLVNEAVAANQLEAKRFRCNDVFQMDRNDTVPPACLIVEATTECLRAAAHVRSFLWPVPTIAMSKGCGQLLTVDQGIWAVIEPPHSPANIATAIENCLSHTRNLVEVYRQQMQAIDRIASLTENERAVLSEIIQETPYKTIAHRLGISMRTVNNRRRDIFHKLQVNTVGELLEQYSLAEYGNAIFSEPPSAGITSVVNFRKKLKQLAGDQVPQPAETSQRPE